MYFQLLVDLSGHLELNFLYCCLVRLLLHPMWCRFVRGAWRLSINDRDELMLEVFYGLVAWRTAIPFL